MGNNFKIRILVFLGACVLAIFQQYWTPRHKESIAVKKYIFILLVGLLLLLFQSLPITVVPIHCIISLLCMLELFDAKASVIITLTSVFSFGLFVLASYYFSHEILVELFLLTCIFDGYSEIIGKQLGRKKIIPTISPNKTWMGLFGGTIAALVGGIILYTTTHTLTLGHIISVPILAFFGDLWASKIKRSVNKKDFGKLLPGQGGMLDRFDSYIAVLIGLLVTNYLIFN